MNEPPAPKAPNETLVCEACGRPTGIRYYFPGLARVTGNMGHGLWLCPPCLAGRTGVEIPETLRRELPGAHYIRVAPCDKRPIDPDWANNPMEPGDPRLAEHLKRGGNYGVVGGNGLVILDADADEVKRAVGERLPETFTVKSPGSFGHHYYYWSDLERPVRLRGSNGANVGDVQGHGKMVVGPGSFHPNGWRYRVVRDLPIARVPAEELREALAPWIALQKPEVETLAERARRERSLVDIGILDVVPLAGLRRSGDEYYGAHPVHGSRTGRNFWVNTRKNVWHCFRCDSGGGPLLWVAVQEGIIDCSEAGPGALRGEAFKRVLQALEGRGFRVPRFLASFGGELVEVGGAKARLPVGEYPLRNKGGLKL